MLLGYNLKRPVAEDYKNFEKKIVEGLESLGIEGLSLMIYGSYIRGDYNPGRSDIDGVMVFPDDVIIDKSNLNEVSKVVRNALKGNNVPFQVSVCDLGTMKDGRFNTYDESFDDYFAEEGTIFVGPDYRNEFCYEFAVMCEQSPVRFNLRKCRIGLLFAEKDKEDDYETFLKNFTATLNCVSRGSKQIMYFTDGILRKNRFEAQDLIQKVFPGIDIEPLLRIKELYANLDKLDAMYHKPDEVMQLWNDSVTFFESMIKAYMIKVPKNP